MTLNLAPMNFKTMATITPEKVTRITNWHNFAVNTANNLPGSDVDGVAYYTGAAHMAEDILKLIHDNVPVEKVVEVAKVLKKNNRLFGVRKIYIYAAVLYIVVDGRLVKRVKAKVSKVVDEVLPPAESTKPSDNPKN